MTKKRNDIEELVEASLSLVDNECGTCIAPGQLVSDMPKEVNVLEFPKAKSIVVSGDIHGEFTQLVFKCCVQYGMTDTLIIVAGDCGFGFEREGYYEGVYKRCSARLSKANNWLLFVRGNHDNPAYFNLKPIKHRRWMTLPDYSVVKACGHTMLCVVRPTMIPYAFSEVPIPLLASLSAG